MSKAWQRPRHSKTSSVVWLKIVNLLNWNSIIWSPRDVLLVYHCASSMNLHYVLGTGVVTGQPEPRMPILTSMYDPKKMNNSSLYCLPGSHCCLLLARIFCHLLISAARPSASRYKNSLKNWFVLNFPEASSNQLHEVLLWNLLKACIYSSLIRVSPDVPKSLYNNTANDILLY